MSDNFISTQAGNFTITNAATAVTIPSAAGTMVLSNASATDAIWFTTSPAATIAIPATNSFGTNVGYLAPATVQAFNIAAGGTYQFISTGASTTINIAVGGGQ